MLFRGLLGLYEGFCVIFLFSGKTLVVFKTK